MAENDTWPQRVGIPSLQQIVAKLDWIEGCLVPSARQQRMACQSIRNAVLDVNSAIDALLTYAQALVLECKACRGSGDRRTSDGTVYSYSGPCKACNGTGKRPNQERMP